MSRERLYLFDTTLRDGQQTAGVDFALEEKLIIARELGAMGMDYIEGGFPGASTTDTAFFAEERDFGKARVTAFGMTKRAGRSASNDPGLQTVLAAKSDAFCFVGKSWDYHVEVALGVTLDENLAAIRDTIKAAVSTGRETMIDCEHFFDGYKANPDYALSCAKAAFEEGARWIVLCDTNGGTLPHEVFAIVSEVKKHIPGERLGIHAHDDAGCAVANSLAAVSAGVRQIQGTLNGLGERCGNANLISLIPTLKLKPEFADKFEIGISDDGLKNLTHISRQLDEMLNRNPNRHAPYVGANAFVTKAGIHASAILKDPRTYEHIPPEAVGNRRRVMVSDQGGRSSLLAELERIGLQVNKDDPRIARLLDTVRERENAGYAYDGAEASFELLARRALGSVPDYFDVDSFRTSVERRHNAMGELVTVCEAVVKVTVKGEARMSVAEGNGPVNALDVALRKDLGIYQPFINDLKLTDFKVRILNGGTEAVTRVTIESADDSGDVWTTVGVSPNIIDASFQALVDSITYKLVKSGAPAP
ncbi:citramalate synthase [Terrihabitans soli]|uniref:Citramalate synthase n=1 Tax=Terrihabitans soli TaxID=708113 RepID=A0A6S6QV66_9HYPH|nr:citramalate synthase [Terrihabitans soli]BCJ90398.1 citramalate synthase [Terrihabitans soli]